MEDSNKLVRTSNGLEYIGANGQRIPCTPAPGEPGTLGEQLAAVTNYIDDPLRTRNKFAAWQRARAASLEHVYREAFAQAASESLLWRYARDHEADWAACDAAVLEGTNTPAEFHAFGREKAFVFACDAHAEGADLKEWSQRARRWAYTGDDSLPPEPKWPEPLTIKVE